jgi:hypothetical protein
MDDSQTQIWRIPLVFAQERREDREEKESGNVFLAACGEETRASGAVFQEALIFCYVSKSMSDMAIHQLLRFQYSSPNLIL